MNNPAQTRRQAIVLTIALTLLLVQAPDANALSEYAYLFNPQQPDVTIYYTSFEYCGNYAGDFELVGGISARREFANSLDLAYKAKAELDYARQLAGIQRDYSRLSIAALATNTILSYECSNRGANALSLAVKSVREAMDVADAKINELDAAVDASYSGPAAGALAEARNVKKSFEANESFGLGGRILRSSEAVRNAWVKTVEGKGDFVQPLRELVGRDSLLREIIALDNKASDALLSLDEELDAEKQAFERDYAVSKLALEFSSKERLDEVAPESFTFIDAGKTLRSAAARDAKSFRERLQSAEELAAIAEATGKSAASTAKSSARGHATRAITLYRLATGNASAVKSIVTDLDAESKWLDEQLAAKVVAEVEYAEKLVASRSNDNSFTAARLAGELDDVKFRLEASQDRPRGDRIAAFTSSLQKLADIENQASAAQADDDAVTRAKAGIEAAKRLAAAAREDGIAVDAEAIVIKDAETAMAATRDAEQVAAITARVDGARSAITARACGTYATLADAAREASSYDEASADEIDAILALFPGGECTADSLGKLATAERKLQEINAEGRKRQAAAVERQLEENLEVAYAAVPAGVGEETEIRVTVTTWNSLGNAENVTIPLQLNTALKKLAQLGSSSGVAYAGEAITISQTARGMRHWLELNATGIATEASAPDIQVERADDAHAVVTESRLASAWLDATAFLESEAMLPDGTQCAYSGTVVQSYSCGNRPVATLGIRNGSQAMWVNATFFINNPLAISRRTLAATPTSASIELSVENKLGFAIDDARIVVREPTACSNSKTAFKSDSARVVYTTTAGNESITSLSIKLAPNGAATIFYEVYCDPISALAEAKMREAGAAANATETAEITRLLESGDYRKALDRANAILDAIKPAGAVGNATDDESEKLAEVAARLALPDLAAAASEFTTNATIARLKATAIISSHAAEIKSACKRRDYSIKKACGKALPLAEGAARLASTSPVGAATLLYDALQITRPALEQADKDAARRANSRGEYERSRSTALSEAAAVELAFTESKDVAKALPSADASLKQANKVKSLDAALGPLFAQAKDGSAPADEYDPETIEKRVADFISAAQELSRLAGEVKATVTEAVAKAQERARTTEEKDAASRAARVAEEGKWFTALAIASTVYGGADSGAGSVELALGGLAIAILIALAYSFWWNKRKPQEYTKVE